MSQIMSALGGKKIVIAGAGFGGTQTAVGLSKKFRRRKDISIILVDKRDYHLFTYNLFEVATAEEELVTLPQLKRSVALPVKEIIKGKNIKFVRDEAALVDQLRRTVTLGKGVLDYDYLILALGSVTDYFGVEGAAKYGLPLKTLADAFRIRNQIEFAVASHRVDANKKALRFVVAGGGHTSVEFTGELCGMLEEVAWKNSFPREKIEVLILEAGNHLAGGFSERMSRDALFRLQEFGVRVELNSRVAEVTEHFITLADSQKIAYDVLVWLTGIKANTISFKQPMAMDSKLGLLTNGYLQTKGYPNIFVVGDQCCILDEQGKPMPSTAQDAIAQGNYLAYALPYFINNQKPEALVCKKHGFIVNIGGKYAILESPSFYFKGFWAYFIDKLVHVRYLIGLVGLYKAVKYVFWETVLYSRND